jgi:restriction system protein
MLPLLQFMADNKERSLGEVREHLADEFALSNDDRAQLLPSGQQPVFTNRVAWAKVYLSQAGLLVSERRGYFQISPAGLKVLQGQPQKIGIKFLEQFPKFIEFKYRSRKRQEETPEPTQGDEETETPEETLDSAYQKIRGGLVSELLAKIKDGTPHFF